MNWRTRVAAWLNDSQPAGWEGHAAWALLLGSFGAMVIGLAALVL